MLGLLALGLLVWSPRALAQPVLAGGGAAELEIQVVAPKGAESSLGFYRDPDDGSLAAVLAYPVTMKLAAAGFELRADAAVIWTKRRDTNTALEGVYDEFTASIKDFDSLEFYAEGSVRVALGKGADAPVFRGDRMHFLISRTLIPSPLATPEYIYSFTGSVDNFRGHVDANAMAALRPAPKTGGEESEGLKLADSTGPNSGRRASGIDAGVATEGAKVVSQDDGGFALEEGVKIFLRAKQARFHSLDTTGRVSADFTEPVVATSSLAVPNFSFRAAALGLRLSKVRNTAIFNKPAVYLKDTRLLKIEKEAYVYDIDSRFPVSRFSIGQSDAMGASVRTKIDVVTAYDFFWDPEPPFRPFKLSPMVDYFEKRGTGLGLELELERIQPFGTGFTAWMQGYTIHDDGDRRDIARELGYFPLVRDDRGRFRGYGRLRMAGDWQIDTNVNYQSDKTFIEEFLREEFLANDVDTTFVRLTRKFNNRTFYIESSVRARHFVDEVERLPVLGFSTQRENIGPRGLGLQLSAEAELGNFRMQLAQPGHELDERNVTRGDLTMRVYRPTDFGLFSVDPFVGFRITAADARVEDAASNPLFDPIAGFAPPASGTAVSSQGQTRFQGLFGATLQTNLTRVYPSVSSRLFDMRGLRHIITPSVRWENVVGPSREASQRFLQLDEVDAAVAEQVVVLSLRNRLQTMRNIEGTEQTVDVANLLLELPVYPNRERDNNGMFFGDLEVLGEVSPNRHIAFRGGAFIETRRGNWKRLFGSAATTIGPATWRVYFRSMRGLHEIVGVNTEANLSKTYALSFDQEYDVRAGRFRDTSVRISRTFYETLRLSMAITRDSVREDVGFSFGISGTFGPASLGGN